ncbi:hypothetical protein PULV_a3093 [Pseudoalteromonas ulvae UL12]|uniref:hypothetical protein n=1 Tax=Pseudoalteromonas ulvae TaxID=107327 RepID=UPI00186B60DE|nr:hypothetical protein [Pseudoalteromonas ulvae]MBE0362454.1 hypothetical protein [Pseudoalteromonas ulvae UL12]
MNQETEEEFKEFKHMLGSGALRMLLNIKIGEPILDGLAEQLSRDNAQFHDNNINVAKCYKFLKYQLSEFGIKGIELLEKDQVNLQKLFNKKVFSYDSTNSEINYFIPDAWAVLSVPCIEDRRKNEYRIFSNCFYTDSIKLSSVFTSFNQVNETSAGFEWNEQSGVKYLLYKERFSKFTPYALEYLTKYYITPYSNPNNMKFKGPEIMPLERITLRVS